MIRTAGSHNYYVYITTNKNKQVLCIGVTNNLQKRLKEHIVDAKSFKKHFAGRYNCIHLVYYERYELIEDAIRRETEIKDWRREKKIALINASNPEWPFMNDDLVA
jgi:putative endonuclease